MKLNDKIIKALSSDKRFHILARLWSHNMTVTDLSRDLNLPKSTIYDNLMVLVNSGLVKKNKRNKWVYYELTKYGHEIFQNLVPKFLCHA